MTVFTSFISFFGLPLQVIQVIYIYIYIDKVVLVQHVARQRSYVVLLFLLFAIVVQTCGGKQYFGILSSGSKI